MRFVENFGKPAYEEKIGKDNYQPQHAYMAVANGGVFGVFPGNSRERDFLPQAFSDFIYAIIVEEMGMVGYLRHAALYVHASAGGCDSPPLREGLPGIPHHGAGHDDSLPGADKHGCLGGSLPGYGAAVAAGEPGGTSFLITSAYFGIMLSVSRYARQAGKNEQIKEPLAEESGDISAPNPAQI